MHSRRNIHGLMTKYLFNGGDMTHEERFNHFHENNPLVYDLFKKFTFEVIEKGFTKWSADAIMHRVRWETNIVTDDQQFKINNNYVAFYARLFMSEYPEYAGFFEIRRQISA